MTAKAKITMLVKQAEEIMSDPQEMNRNGGKIRFELEGTKNMQTRMHKELNKWFYLSDAELELREKIYYSIFYSINAMTIE